MGRDDRQQRVRRSLVSTFLAGVGVMFAITLVSPIIAEAYPPTTPSSTSTSSTSSTSTSVQILLPTTTSIPSTTIGPTTTIVEILSPTTTTPGQIPATGSNSVDQVQVAVVAVVAGLCLLGVVALRRRPQTA